MFFLRGVLVIFTATFPMLIGCVPVKNFIDLSYAFGEKETMSWPEPGSGSYVHTVVYRGSMDSYWYESNKFQMDEHSGTHIDAPAHFAEGKQRIHDIPTERLIAPGIKVNISHKTLVDPDTFLEVADLKNWERENGVIPNGAIVMVFTGWGKFYQDRASYFGSNRNDTYQENGTAILHFPGIGTAAADWLIANRDIVGMGIDTPSVDYGQSLNFTTHRTLSKENIYALENVANLDKMPILGCTVYALPVIIKDGSGAPVRLFAILDNGDVNDATLTYHTIVQVLVIGIGFILLIKFFYHGRIIG